MSPKFLLLNGITLLLSGLVSVGYSFLAPNLSTRCRHHSILQESTIDTELPPKTPVKVGIIGAGSIAFGTASLLSSLGHDPMIWSPSGEGTKDLITTSKIQSTGALSQTFNVRVAHSTRDLVRSNDNVLVVALPVNCHKDVMDRLAPDIVGEHGPQVDANVWCLFLTFYAVFFVLVEWMMESEQLMRIIISSHASLGAVYFMQLLWSEWQRIQEPSTAQSDFDKILITCWGTTAITARKTGGSSVNVLTIRQTVDYCTVPFNPEDANNDALLQTLFGQRFRYRDGGLLAISLSNLNPQNHLGIVLGNMSRMDPPPPPLPWNEMKMEPVIDTATEPWYQGKCITPKVGRLMEALDLERINIAKSLQIDVRTIYEHFSWSFHVPLETSLEIDGETMTRPLTVSEMNQQMHYYLKNDVLGPATPDSRYVLEDVPYGLVLTVILGRLLNCPALLHEAGIMILSAMYGRDFLVENELLKGIGLIVEDELDVDAYKLQEWKEMACSGFFRKKGLDIV